MMMMINCFCVMVDRRKACRLIFSQDHFQRSSPSRISDTSQVGFEPAQNLSSGLVEWSCVVVITTTLRRQWDNTIFLAKVINQSKRLGCYMLWITSSNQRHHTDILGILVSLYKHIYLVLPSFLLYEFKASIFATPRSSFV